MTKAGFDKAFDKALTAMRQPDAKLMRQNGHPVLFYICIPHKSFEVSEGIAMKLLERNDIQPFDSGLLPGHPQSWKLGGSPRAAGRSA